jgi:hypothetical protein
MHNAEFWFYSSGRDGWGVFHREMEVPFVPVPGLAVCFAEDGDDDECWEIRQSAWVAGEKKFVCWVGDDTDPSAAWEEIRDFYTARGWTLDSVATGGEQPGQMAG